MISRGMFGFFVFIAILVLIDVYAFKGIGALNGLGPTGKRWVRLVYWAISIGMLALLVWVSISIQELRGTRITPSCSRWRPSSCSSSCRRW